MNNDITIFAKTNFRNGEHRFGIKTDDRRRHMYLIGKTGMGKTQLLENMIVQDIRAGRGLAYVDPHGDTVERLLYFIPKERINDVVYFNPADMDYPIAFNVLEKVPAEQRHLMVSGLIGVFKKIWADSWGPRLEYVLHHTIQALVEYPNSTLLGIMRMLVDKTYRNKVIEQLTDPVVKSFWVDEYAKYPDQLKAEAIAPIQNKVGRFLSSSLMRNIVGQVQSSINMRDIMDNGKIFLINLSKGRVGEDNSALLGALLITKIQLAAMSRVDTPENERRDFYLYVDEFQNFATESFANILSEARKYRLSLIVAHQYIAQLASGENTYVRDAVFGNVGTIITFRVGAADAEFLEQEFMPEFEQVDLVNLPKYQVYLKLMIDGVTSNSFSATTLPPFDVPVDGAEIRDKVIKISRERYATNREEVEEKIIRWADNNMLASKLEHQLASEGGQVHSEQRREYPLSRLPRRDEAPRERRFERPVGKIESSYREAPTRTERPRSTESRPDSSKPAGSVSVEVSCYNCGEPVKLNFIPKSDKPIYCRDCLNLPKDQRKQWVPVPEHNDIPKAITLDKLPPAKSQPDAAQSLRPDQAVKF
ncbi:MAG: type IV secretion system DNA-binding domain-containing protein [Candidatus Komeilibacteria bacterium]